MFARWGGKTEKMVGSKVVDHKVLLSIVVLNFRTLERTRHALQSAVTDLSIAFELIVVDNSSKDGSADAIKCEFPEARLLVMPYNAGYAAGMNSGIRESRGEYILLLNSDVEAQDGSVEALVRYMDENLNVGLAAPVLYDENGKVIRSLLIVPTIARALLPWLAKFDYKRWHKRIGQEPMLVEAIEGAAVIVRKSAIEKAGPLDEKFFFYHEIDEWCMRMRDCGLEVILYPESRMIHGRGGSSGGVSKSALIELKRSEYYLLAKRFGSAFATLIKMRDFVAELLSTFFYFFMVSLTLGGNARMKDKLSAHQSFLTWMMIGMPDHRNPVYIRLFGGWD